MHKSLRQDNYWSHMAKDVSKSVAQCMRFVGNGKKYKHERPLQLFPLWEAPECLAMKILKPLSRTTTGNQYVLVMTDRHFKLPRKLPTAKKRNTQVANTFFDHWIFLSGVSSYALNDNRPRFAKKILREQTWILRSQIPDREHIPPANQRSV